MHTLPKTVVRKEEPEQKAAFAQQAFLSSHAYDAVSEMSFGTLPPPAFPIQEEESLPERAEEPSVRRSAVSSAAWAMLGFGVMQILRFGSNLILSRLLAPDVFGLMALVNVFIQGLHMLSDIGIGPSIVQSKREDSDLLDTAWTLQIVRGFILWLASILIAWPVSLIYGDPKLLALIPAVGFASAISGLNSTSMFVLQRRLMQGRLVTLEVANYALSQAITVVWVWYHPTVWALVVGSLIASTIQMLCSHLLLPGFRNRLRWDKAAVHDVLHFGKWIFVGTLFTFIGNQADRLIVGKQSLQELGIYHFAVMLATIPITLIGSLNWQLMFPFYSRALQSGGDLRETFAKVHLPAVAFESFLVSGLIAAGPAFVDCIYPARYQDAGWMVQILAVGAWFTMVEATGGSLQWAMGKSGQSAASNAAKVVALPICASIGFYYGGLTGMIVGFVASDFARYFVTAFLLWRQGLPSFRYDVCLALCVGGVALVALVLDQQSWIRFNPWLRFGIEVMAVIFLWLTIVAVALVTGQVRGSWKAET